MSVILIEADKVGGTGLHQGCIPTKALLHSAEVADMTRAAESLGIRSTFDGIDMAAVHAYKDSVATRLYKGLEGLLAGPNITVVRGFGRHVGDRTVDVDGTSYTGGAVVLATGSAPRQISGLTIDSRILTSDQALRNTDVPRTAIVLGGGVIGVEFASMWASFGSTVTIVEALPRLVASEDSWTSTMLERALRRRGVTINTGTAVTEAQQNDDGVSVQLDGGAVLRADVLLVAVGRVPRSAGFAEAGIATDRGFVTVDDRLASNHDGVYAVGDIVAGPQLAHRGFAHGIHVAEGIAGLQPTPIDDALIPRVNYAHPEIALGGSPKRRRVKYTAT